MLKALANGWQRLAFFPNTKELRKKTKIRMISNYINFLMSFLRFLVPVGGIGEHWEDRGVRCNTDNWWWRSLKITYKCKITLTSFVGRKVLLLTFLLLIKFSGYLWLPAIVCQSTSLSIYILRKGKYNWFCTKIKTRTCKSAIKTFLPMYFPPFL